MEYLRNRRQPSEGRPTVVTGETLSKAFRSVRRQFGDQAVISGSRTRTRRKAHGWGSEKVVEVLVETGAPGDFCETPPAGDLTNEIRLEVARLERMVAEICDSAPGTADMKPAETANPLAEHLVAKGASSGAVARLLVRYTGETGGRPDDRPGIISWLQKHLAAGPSSLEDWQGGHLFLGEHTGDRLDFILQLADRQTALGRRVLVLAVLPDQDRDTPLLKDRAAGGGYDAAVVREPQQLADLEENLSGYDLVLLDLPGLVDQRLAEDGPVHRLLAANEKFHRHLMMPLDRDFQDLEDLREAARVWNCDWLALTRLDGTRRPAKLLDLFERIPLPVSFMSENTVGDGLLDCATADLLLERIMAMDTTSRSREANDGGGPAATTDDGMESAKERLSHTTRKAG